jgi:uncharacterized protein with GYD domain
MPTYILLSSLTAQGVQTLKSNPDRLREVNKDVEELGAKVVHQWATLGEYDFVNIVEAPDAATVARVSVALGARGSTKIRTLTALTIDEFLGVSCRAPRLGRRPDDGDAPRPSGREELVGVELVGPAEEVPLGVVGGRAVHGAAPWRVGGSVDRLAPLERIPACFCRLRDRTFLVASGHCVECTLAPCPQRSPSAVSSSVTAPSTHSRVSTSR